MKKITLLTLVGSAILVAGSLFAKEQRIWNGLQSKTWDMIETNWTNPNDGIYPITILGTNTSPDATNYFDDSTDSLNVKVSGTVTMDSLLINSTKNYVIDT